jgi:hypothetical protein
MVAAGHWLKAVWLSPATEQNIQEKNPMLATSQDSWRSGHEWTKGISSSIPWPVHGCAVTLVAGTSHYPSKHQAVSPYPVVVINECQCRSLEIVLFPNTKLQHLPSLHCKGAKNCFICLCYLDETCFPQGPSTQIHWLPVMNIEVCVNLYV